jgi:hypothetical protein
MRATRPSARLGIRTGTVHGILATDSSDTIAEMTTHNWQKEESEEKNDYIVTSMGDL